MKKFWTKVKNVSRACGTHEECVVVHGTLADAIDYAWTYMADHHIGRNIVSIYDADWHLVHTAEW